MFNKNYNAYLNFLFLYKAILMAFPNVDINRSSSSTQIHCSSEAGRPISTSASYAYESGWSSADPERIPWIARPYLYWNLVCVGAIATRLKQDDSWLFHWVKINSIWASAVLQSLGTWLHWWQQHSQDYFHDILCAPERIFKQK